jgi:hypothetical protein
MLVVNLDDDSAMYYGTGSHVQPSKPTAQQPDIPSQTDGTVSHVQLIFNSQEDIMTTLLEAAHNIASFIEQKGSQALDGEYANITRSEFKAEEKELDGLLVDLGKALSTNTNVAAILVAREVIGRSANAVIESLDNSQEVETCQRK